MPYSTVLMVVALLLTTQACGRGALAEGVSYVLEPRAVAPIGEIFERMKPALRYTDVAIERDAVEAQLCRGDAAGTPCFTLRLEHPSTGCDTPPSGQFCARFVDARVPPEVAALVADALRASIDQSIWTALPSERSRKPSVARTLGTSLALTLVPVVAGVLFGSAWRRGCRQRRKGTWFTIAALAVPAMFTLLADARIELVGAWDALYVGLATGAGLLLALHQDLGDSKTVALLLASCVAAVVALEVACRLVLPPPPAFPSAGGPTLFLPELRRFTPAQAFSAAQAGFSTCYALYGGDTVPPKEWGTIFPADWRPRPDARQRILHLGDSMVFGSGPARFTDELNRLEPDVEHVNAAIPGTAPDVYLALLRRFIAQHDVTAVVMHLTPNDYGGVDERQYPCSGWQPLLVYEPSGTRLRFPPGRPHSGEKGPLAWLMQNSPPPYILRGLVGSSSFAAHLSAALVHVGRRLGDTSADESDTSADESEMSADERDLVREAHLAAILRDARDELGARHIPLVVDSFRDRRSVEAATEANDRPAERMKQIAESLDIVTLDTRQPLVTAAQRGADIYVSPEDPHFNAVGHALMAAWLHDELPGAIARARLRDGTPLVK